MLEVNEGSVWPELARDLLAGEEFAGAVEQQAEYLEGLCIELDADALAAELASGCVGFECSKAIAPRWLWVGHVVSSVTDEDWRASVGLGYGVLRILQ